MYVFFPLYSLPQGKEVYALYGVTLCLDYVCSAKLGFIIITYSNKMCVVNINDSLVMCVGYKGHIDTIEKWKL